MTETRTDWRGRLEDRLARPLFLLAAAHLVLLAGVIHRAQDLETPEGPGAVFRFCAGGLVVLWPVFLAYAVLRCFLYRREDRTWKRLAYALAIGLLPPLQLGARGATRPDQMWLPWLGWREVDYDLEKTLERFFGVPMFFMALLILPVLAVEYFWSDWVEQWPALRLVLDVGVSLIWLAFTAEFVIRISAAEKKLSYAFEHWVDLAVVLFPTLQFLPFLRVLRLTRLAKLRYVVRMAKYYRLYGLAGKGWRALVVLEVLRRFFSRSPEARLSSLKGQLEEKEAEAREVEREIDYYRRKIADAERDLARRGGRPPRSDEEETRPVEERQSAAGGQ